MKYQEKEKEKGKNNEKKDIRKLGKQIKKVPRIITWSSYEMHKMKTKHKATKKRRKCFNNCEIKQKIS